MTPKKLLYPVMFIAVYCALGTPLFAQTTAPPKQWDKRFGGSGYDYLLSLQETTGGGYILGGFSASGAGDDKTENSRGAEDYWMVKTGADGNKQWDKTYGGTLSDGLYAIRQTTDGGFILGGYSASGAGGDKTEDNRGIWDYWIVKTDANGNKQWDKRFGGPSIEVLYALQQTTDGGYILGGYTLSGMGGDKTEDSRGAEDYWIVKTDADGNKQWDKRFGGTGEDILFWLQQTMDGGYILGGRSASGIGGDKTQGNRGDHDYWVVKTDASGNRQWDKRFGGKEFEQLNYLAQMSDGGYILGGSSNSGKSGDKTEDSWGGNDYWIVKTDPEGVKQWDKRYGGPDEDILWSMQQTADKGFIMGGYSISGYGGDKTEDSCNQDDYWIVKADSNGVKQWDKRFGGADDDRLYSILQTKDGGFMMGGFSLSNTSCEKSDDSRGIEDYWIVKMAAEILPVNLKLFTAQQIKNDIQLNWQTVTEENTSYFTIEHATDGKTFSAIGKVNAAGNSNTLMYYHFLHDHPGNGMHYYRLKTVDKDGQFSSSATASVYMGNDIAVLVYPNPTTGNITVIYNSTVNAAIQLNVIDITGKKFFTKTLQAIAGSNQYQLNVSGLAAGIYTLQINNNNVQQQVKLVIYK